MELVYKQYEIVKDSFTSELQKMKGAGVKFSLSLDETLRYKIAVL